jgi:ribosomal protein S18 acetylase RimI-like enzyme
MDTSSFSLQPASDFSLADLADLLTRSFEGYFVPIRMDVSALLGMIRRDSVDLTCSRVLLANGEPAALALIARRGSASRLAAMGVVPVWRGRSAGSYAVERLLEEARQRGERTLYLEVIDRNEAAIRLYEKYGFHKMRRLFGFAASAPAGQSAALTELEIPEVADLVVHHGYAELPWQLAGETLSLFATPSRAFRLDSAYVVTSTLSGGHASLWSVLTEPSARGQGQARRLLRALFAAYPNKTWHASALFPEEMSGFLRKGRVCERRPGTVSNEAGIVKKEAVLATASFFTGPHPTASPPQTAWTHP